MNKLLIIFFFAIILVSSVQADIIREMLPEANQDGIITVTIHVEDAKKGERVVVSERIPVHSNIRDWEIIGSQEERNDITYIRKNEDATWEFTASKNVPSITYVIRLPEKESDAAFDAVYAVEPTTFGHSSASIHLLPLVPGLPGPRATSGPAGQSTPLPQTTTQPFVAFMLTLILLVGIVYAIFHVSHSEGLPSSLSSELDKLLSKKSSKEHGLHFNQ